MVDLGDVRDLMQNPPPGARGFFIEGGQRGGWHVELPDGTIATYYVELPDHLKRTVATSFHFADPPRTHLGETLQDTSVAALAQHYITYMERLVAAAVARFGTNLTLVGWQPHSAASCRPPRFSAGPLQITVDLVRE
jgi:hypothetical protein